jgi:hypothetical protein
VTAGECAASGGAAWVSGFSDAARASKRLVTVKHWQKGVGGAAGEFEGKLNRCR